jgi:type IV pilus assembly protein PilA
MGKTKATSGFTLLELMVVLAVMAILAMIALPSLTPKYTRAQINESLDLLKNLKESINVFYLAEKKFPRNNAEAGIPKPEFLLGNYVERIDFDTGAFHIIFGNKVTGVLKNRVLTVRPMVVAESPESPISWVCGNSSVPTGMMAVGQNKTDIDNIYLPLNCN